MQFYKRIPIFAATVLALMNPLESLGVGPLPPTGGPPPPVLAKIEIDGPLLIDENTSASYVCKATYSDGEEAIVSPVWSEDSSFTQIDASGELTAGNVDADEVVYISASFGEKTATYTATIKYVEPVISKIGIEGPVLVDENTSATYVCTATYSDGAEVVVSPDWSEDSDFAEIDTFGELTAASVASDEVVNISAGFDGKTATYTATIKYITPVLSSLSIGGPTSIDENSSGSFSCIANYSDGSTLSVVPAWSTTHSSVTIDSAGNLISGSVDTDEVFDVIASLNGVTGRYTVTLKDIPVILEGITIQGKVAVNENSSVQLNCIASYSDGSQPLISPVWSVNSSHAQIAQNGLLSAGNVTADQGVSVTARFDGETASHSVLIKYIAPALERIEISGAASIAEGSSAGYTCTAYYDDDTSKAVVPSWSEDSSYAAVDSSGLLVASDVQSDQTLSLTASYEGQTDSKQVLIMYDVPAVVSLAIDGATIVEEHNETRYTCNVDYSDGTSEYVVPVWSVDPSLAEIDEEGRLRVGEIDQDEVVTVTASYGGSLAAFEVSLKDIPPTVSLESISISGLTDIMERESITLVCNAHYSDGTSETVTPAWSDDSSVASISANGEFSAGNFEADAVVGVTASYAGVTATHQVSVQMVGTEIMYPLTGFEGRVVAAELYDNETGEWRDFGPFESPEELVLDELNTNQWYWVSILESNTTSNVWVEVQGNWLNL